MCHSLLWHLCHSNWRKGSQSYCNAHAALTIINQSKAFVLVFLSGIWDTVPPKKMTNSTIEMSCKASRDPDVQIKTIAILWESTIDSQQNWQTICLSFKQLICLFLEFQVTWLLLESFDARLIWYWTHLKLDWFQAGLIWCWTHSKLDLFVWHWTWSKLDSFKAGLVQSLTHLKLNSFEAWLFWSSTL